MPRSRFPKIPVFSYISKLYRITGFSGLALFILLTVIFTASLLFPYDPAQVTYVQPLQKPGISHLLGTDHLGRDVLALILSGTKMSLLVSLSAVSFGAIIGICIGCLAAMMRNGWGEIFSRIGDFIFAFPVLVVAILLRQSLGAGPLPIILAIGIFNIAIFIRTTFGSAFPLWQREYVLAARAVGKSRLLISFQHILPNISGILTVQISLQLAMAILAEAGLSWLGVGIQPPSPSLGRMLMESVTYYWQAPQLVLIPAGLIITISLLLNILGDRLRDYMDPRLSDRKG